MRLKTLTFIRLERKVSRWPFRCGWCGNLHNYPDPIFAPRVDGRSLGFYCSERCATFVVKVPMQVVYAAAA